MGMLGERKMTLRVGIQDGVLLVRKSGRAQLELRRTISRILAIYFIERTRT
jgi:hypothetical protein